MTAPVQTQSGKSAPTTPTAEFGHESPGRSFSHSLLFAFSTVQRCLPPMSMSMPMFNFRYMSHTSLDYAAAAVATRECSISCSRPMMLCRLAGVDVM